MWIVKLALRRPYTFLVMALLILLLGVTSIKNTPADTFPEIDIPVVTVVWPYIGLSPDQMAKQTRVRPDDSATSKVAARITSAGVTENPTHAQSSPVRCCRCC
jgi:Cu/Ag efflux pump CusA